MAGNTIGVEFRVTTWGESHGAGVGASIDGCPPGIPLGEADIQKELARRKTGRIPSTSSRKEKDDVEILSGVFEGKTTGTPISLLIRNVDADSAAYEDLRDVFRPGHGDYTYFKKYGLRDHRGGGRASGRETAARVAAGAVARKVIAREGIRVVAFTRELAGITAQAVFLGQIDLGQIDKNPFFCPDPGAAEKMKEELERVREMGDSVGGIVEIRVQGCPPGLGEPVFDKIDADLAKALMSIGTVRGVEIGAGFEAARRRGSENNDPIGSRGFLTNHAGGILAGITTGEEIVIRVSCKPIASIRKEQDTIDTSGNPLKIAIRGRHDVCVIPRIVPVCEAMTCLVVADHLLRQRAIKAGKC